MNQFDYEREGRALTQKALGILERPVEIPNEDPFKQNASLCTEFIIVQSVEEYQQGQGIKFQPDYMHQVFRDNNEIYGYRNLKIKIYVAALSLVPYVTYTYDEVCEDADVIEVGLQKLYEGGYLKKDDEARFLEILSENEAPIGKHFMTYFRGDKTYDVYISNILTKGFVQFKPNLQAFLLILIDGAQFPCDSEFWTYFVVYERGPKGPSFMGLGTLYSFYLSAHVSRQRLSQMLFLPPYIRKGHGGELLKVIYKYCHTDETCKQITLEDPSEDFQVMRDITDSKLLYPEFTEFNNIKKITSLEQFRNAALTKERLLEIMRKTKLHSQQVKRAHMIILFALINNKNRNIMVEFTQLVLANLKSQMKPFNRLRNPLVVFEDGENLNPQQMHFLEQNERMQKQNINYEEIVLEELGFFGVIVDKLKRDNVL